MYELAIGDLTGRYLADFDQVTLHVDLAPEERRTYETDIGTFRSFHSRFRELHPEASWEDFARSAATEICKHMLVLRFTSTWPTSR